MNYLFFDIECANCFNGNGKICSLGYVLADSDFNILEQKDILVNPKSKFHLRRSGEDMIELGYPKSEFVKAPSFDKLYSTFKNLLEDDGVTVFGHSVNNDINFLLSECNRYKKPYLSFKAYDTQILHRHFMPDSKDNGLGKICESFSIPLDNHHRSDYDAYLTMSVAKKMCETFNMGLDEMLTVCPNCYYSVNNGAVVNHYATVSPSRKLIGYAMHVNPDSKLMRNSKIKNKTLSFSMEFEKENFKQALFLVNAIRRLGGNYSQRVSKLNYFLKCGEECARTQKVAESEKEITVLDEAQLLQLLDINVDLYEEVKSWSLGKIKHYCIDKSAVKSDTPHNAE